MDLFCQVSKQQIFYCHNGHVNRLFANYTQQIFFRNISLYLYFDKQ